MTFDLEKFKNGMKARTRSGKVATFVGICDKCAEQNRLIAFIDGERGTTQYRINGSFYNDPGHRLDLVSMVSIWDDVPVDAKVRVKDDEYDMWLNRHYAGLDKDGNPTAWAGRGTSWSSEHGQRTTWDFMELVDN